MKRYWELACAKIDGVSSRERALVFAAVVFIAISLINATLFDPLLTRQKILSAQVVQQQEKMKEIQAQIQSLLQAKSDDEHSPLRDRLAQLRQQLQTQDDYLQSRRDRLVAPDKMAGLLEQVLSKNDRLQLVELKTLPVGLLLETGQATGGGAQAAGLHDAQKQVFKHGVQIAVRGRYLDLLQYVSALEKMPVQMFWGEARLSVEQYPDAVLTLTVYTLSLDKTWLAV
ncbi:MAG: agglutinin biogenesis protein [Gallionella sp.]|nr:MAG: agglutinin biogenesis protein [Gallionella sp.]